jgi:hypothetical protein
VRNLLTALNKKSKVADKYPAAVSNVTDKHVKGLLKNLVDGGHYAPYLAAIDRGMDTLPLDQFKTAMMQYYDSGLTRQPELNLYYPASRTHTGALNAVKNMKHGIRWAITTVATKTATEPKWKQVDYLTNKYFLGHMIDIRRDLGEPIFQHNIAGGNNNYNYFGGTLPLASLMFKKEDFTLMRAHMMIGDPIDVTKLQLWVDKKLYEGTDPHPIKLQFMRNLVIPMQKAGVDVVVYDDLDVQMYTRMSLPKFKRLDGVSKYRDELIDRFLEDEKSKNGIITEKAKLDQALDAVLQATAEVPRAATLVDAFGF